MGDLAKQLIRATEKLSAAVNPLRAKLKGFAGVEVVYNPLDYALEPYKKYLEKFGEKQNRVLLVGMNPSYDGMTQTGIPFGDEKFVTEGMALDITNNDLDQDKIPDNPDGFIIDGFNHKKEENSGKKLRALIEGMYQTKKNKSKVEQFFDKYFVINYCPLAFLKKTQKDKIANVSLATFVEQSQIGLRKLFTACNQYLLRVIAELEPKYVIGIGKEADRCIKSAICGGLVFRISHPSYVKEKDWVPETIDRLKSFHNIYSRTDSTLLTNFHEWVKSCVAKLKP